jgi:phage-related protein
MDEKECIIYSGAKFTIKWYYDKNGKSVANEFFMESSEELQDKFLLLIKKMAEFGKIYDITKFRNEGDGIFAFKPQPDRYLSFFTHGSKIIVTNGYKKKTDKMPENEKKLALKLKEDYLNRNSGGKK